MSNAFDGLEPTIVWKNFESLTQIPRPSKHEESIVRFMQQWAEDRGFDAVTDEVGNMLIRIPATRGREQVAPTVLQGHLDMVPVKDESVEFDFLTDPINVIRDGDWLKAGGTTLGADNGIGVAMAMAVAEDPESEHGPLELLLTVDEETGMGGAFGLKPDMLAGKRMINIDSEEEGAIFAGCAGGADIETVFPLSVRQLPPDWEVVTVSVSGLQGGHSGLTIHENRGNALKLLATLLHELMKRQELGLCRFVGGDMRNSIPKTAEALIAGKQGLKETTAALVEELAPRFMQEFGTKEPGLTFDVDDGEAGGCISVASSSRLVHLLLALPHGMDTIMPSEPFGLVVETSTNMAVVEWEPPYARIANLTRSSVASAIVRVNDSVHAAARLAGAKAIDGGGYPGWQPRLDSDLLAVARESYKETTGEEANVTAIHAGLECGIIGQAYPEMEMISVGPNMYDVHSPKERLSISSTARFYKYLRALLAALK